MTTSRLPRRAIVGAVLATSLIGTGLLAFADDAAAGPCASWTDPAGDATTGGEPTGLTADDQMDIVAASLANDGDKVVATIKSKKMGDTASDFGDEFHINFTLGGKEMQIYSDRGLSSKGLDPLPAADSPVGFDAGFYNITDDTSGAATAVYDTKASTVTITGTVAELKKALGSDPAGQTATALVAESQDYLSNPVQSTGFLYDDAPTKQTFTVGADCSGGAAVAAPVAPSAAPSAQPSAAPSAPPAASGPAASGAPAAGCFTAQDPKGDAKMRGVNGLPVDTGLPNDPDLDVTGLTLGTEPTALVAYIKVDKLAAAPAYSDGHRFYVSFTFNKHNFTMAGSTWQHGEEAIRDNGNQTGQVSANTQLAVDGTSSATDPNRFIGAGPGFVDSGLKYTFDIKNSVVIARLPLADLEKYGKAPASGAVLSGVYASGNSDYVASAIIVDTVPDGAGSTAPGKLTYTIGDNHCFAAAAPAASPLTNVGAVRAQYGDTAAVAGKLVDASGAPVAGKTVTFTLGSSKAVGTTGTDGIAKASLVVNEKAGTTSLVLTSDALTTSVPFTVLVEKTALKVVNTKGNVTATLTDDDKTPVAGQVITFSLGSKKATAKTDAKGVAKAAGFPAGNVKASYAGAPGMYSASSATAKS